MSLESFRTALDPSSIAARDNDRSVGGGAPRLQLEAVVYIATGDDEEGGEPAADGDDATTSEPRSSSSSSPRLALPARSIESLRRRGGFRGRVIVLVDASRRDGLLATLDPALDVTLVDVVALSAAAAPPPPPPSTAGGGDRDGKDAARAAGGGARATAHAGSDRRFFLGHR